MSNPIFGHLIGKEMAEAFGIPTDLPIRSFNIRFAIDEVVTAKVEYFLEDENGDLLERIRTFKLGVVSEVGK